MANLDEKIKAAADAAAKAVREVLPASEYLSTIPAANYIGVSRQFLEIGRHKGEGPPYIKLGRAVRYKRSDLDAYMAARRRQPSA